MEKHPLHQTAENQLNKLTAKEITAKTKRDLRALAAMLKILPAKTETAIWQKVNAFLQAKLATKNPEKLRNLTGTLATKLALLMIKPVDPKEKESEREEPLTSQEQEVVDTVIIGNLNELDKFFRTGIEKHGPKIFKAAVSMLINGNLEMLVLSKSREIKNALGESEHIQIIKKAVNSALTRKNANVVFEHLLDLKTIYSPNDYKKLLLSLIETSSHYLEGKSIIKHRGEIKAALGEKAMKTALQKALNLLSDDPEVISTEFSDPKFSEIKNLFSDGVIRKFYADSLAKAARNYPGAIFHYSKTIKANLNNDSQYQSIIVTAAQNAVNKEPFYIFIHKKLILPLIGKLAYQKLVEKSASKPREKLLSGNMVVFIYTDTIKEFLGEAKYRQLLEVACVEAANRFPMDIFEQSAQIKRVLGSSLHERFLRLASQSIIEKDPEQVIVDYHERIKKLPWSGNLIKQAAHKLLAENPPFLIKHYSKIKEFPWAFEILKQALKAGPQKKFNGDWKPLNNLGYLSDIFTPAQIQELKKIELETKKLLTIAATTLEPKKKLTGIFMREGLLIRDPALKHLGKINKEWLIAALYPARDQLRPPHRSRAEFRREQEKEISGLQIIIARNLFFQNRVPDQKSVQEEALRIMEERNRYQNLPLFQGRNILFAAHNEKNRQRTILGKKGEIIFGKPATIAAIAKQGGRVSLERPNDTLVSLQHAKQQTIAKFINTPPPFTFVFDGHGGPDALYFSNGNLAGLKILETDKTMKITTAELKDAYLQRRKKFPQKSNTPAHQRDIFILASCFNHTFLRAFYDSLPAQVTKPIIVGCTEYGQVAVSSNSRFGSSFFADTLNLKSGRPSTFQDVFNGEMNQLGSNPSSYIPTENNTLQQLSEREKTTEEIRREKAA